MSGIVDFHSHLMPGVDDGAQSLDHGCAALTHLADEGVTCVITTPHVQGSTTLEAGPLEQRLNALDEAWTELSAHAMSHHENLQLLRGVELMLDVPQPRVDDARLRLAGGSFVLVEFPFMTIPPRSADALFELTQNGYLPIVAHPERYSGFTPSLAVAESWRRSGAHLQVNGPSLLGRYGGEARRIAFALLERGWVDYLSSDYHARGRSLIAVYQAMLQELGAAEQARLLMEENPARLLLGEPPAAVPPLKVKRSLWNRVTELFRS